MMKIKIGDFEFSSKKTAIKYFSDILNKYNLKEKLIGDDFNSVYSLLLNHPDVDYKIGCGVESIIVDKSCYSSQCFHVKRFNGTIENFSIIKCVNGDHSPFHKFSIACRRIVENDIHNYKIHFFDTNKNNNGYVKCQSSGKLINFSDAHVDHRSPFIFSALVYFFIDENKIDINEVKYNTNCVYGNKFTCNIMHDKFREFHKIHARLRVIDKRINMQKSINGRISDCNKDGRL